ncbi:MAG: hypothetical protein ABIO38_03080 [Luteimonas sp.]
MKGSTIHALGLCMAIKKKDVQTRRAAHMDVRRFPIKADAESENNW